MSVQGFIVGVCVLVALAYVLRPTLRRWLQPGRRASGNTGGGQPPGACGACSACSGCPKPRA